MTRQHNKKSVGLTILTAMLIAMVLGFTDLSEQNPADSLAHEFGDLLDGVGAEIQKIPTDTEPAVNTANTLQTEKILTQIAYFEAFDEVIRSQIL